MKNRQPHLLPVFELSEDLLRQAAKFDLLDWLLEVNRDVLGAYFFSGQGHALNPTNEIRVEIYWGVIGIVSQALPASLEDLTATVLAHELAHAYSHLGLDIDRHKWATEHFGPSEHDLVEGLAQYYTGFALQRIVHMQSGAIGVFEKLVRRQPPAYRTHEPWVSDCSPEIVRSAMLETRRFGVGRLSDFNARLRKARGRLKRHSARDNFGTALPGFEEEP
jgi:hypothetical protein